MIPNNDDILRNRITGLFNRWRNDWNLFIKQVLSVTLDSEQQAIVMAVQEHKG